MPTHTNPSQNAKQLSDIQKLAAALTSFAPGLPTPSADPPTASRASGSLSPVRTVECPATGNAAVDRCLYAFSDAYRNALAEGYSEYNANSIATTAYKRAMPPLIGPQNVADFIACVARAVVESFIYQPESSQYLYAAQIANSVKNTTGFPAPRRPRGRPAGAKTTLSQNQKETGRRIRKPDNSSVNSPAQS